MKHLSNQELVARLVELAKEERALLGEVLRHLREVEERQLFVKLAYPSLYVFCIRELGYSEHEAHARIQAMRLVNAVPETERALEQGEISLTVAAQAQAAFRREEKKKTPVAPELKKAIVESLCGSSKRVAEKQLADFFPEPAPRDQVRMLANGQVKVEFVIDGGLWATIEELFAVRSHTNLEKRWEKLIRDMAMLAWKKWHPLGRGRKGKPPPSGELSQ